MLLQVELLQVEQGSCMLEIFTRTLMRTNCDRSILYTLLCRIFLCLEQILLIVHIIENDLARSLNHLDKWSLSSCHWILSLGYAKVLVLCRLVFLHEEIPVSVGA